MKTMRPIAFMLSVATLSSVSLPSANALAKAPLLDPFEVPEAASLQPTSQPASLEQEFVPHMTIAQAGPSFPLTGSAPEERVGREFYIKTDITISNTRRIDGVTRTRTTRNTNGFVGVVEVILTDKDGNILFVTPQQRFAVEGKLIPGPSDRTDRWLVDIPANVPLDKITGYVIVQRNSPPRDILGTLGSIQKLAESIKGIIKVF